MALTANSVDWNDVRSSFIESYSYNELTRLLIIRLESGRMYSYINVSADLVKRFGEAASPGQFYNTHIKGKEGGPYSEYLQPPSRVKDARNNDLLSQPIEKMFGALTNDYLKITETDGSIDYRKAYDRSKQLMSASGMILALIKSIGYISRAIRKRSPFDIIKGSAMTLSSVARVANITSSFFPDSAVTEWVGQNVMTVVKGSTVTNMSLSAIKAVQSGDYLGAASSVGKMTGVGRKISRASGMIKKITDFTKSSFAKQEVGYMTSKTFTTTATEYVGSVITKEATTFTQQTISKSMSKGIAEAFTKATVKALSRKVLSRTFSGFLLITGVGFLMNFNKKMEETRKKLYGGINEWR